MEEVEHGTGNVFAGLGFADAQERQTKLRLARAINDILEKRQIKQIDAASILGVTQPKISALADYRLDGFSVERLMVFLTALGRAVEIVVREKPKGRERAEIIVVAA